MRSSLHRTLALALLVAGTAGSSIAQEYHVRTYTEGDGLPSTEVNDLAQDHEGRLWFATRGGVARFDGREWVAMEPAHEPASVARILIDERGVAWSFAVAPNFDLSRLDEESWTPYSLPELPEGCVATSLAMLRGAEPTRIALGASCGLFLFEGGTWSQVAFGESDRVAIFDVLWHDERLWVATNRGLAVFEGEPLTRATPPEGGPEELVLGLAGDRCDGRPCVWVAGDRWVGRVVDGKFAVEVPDVELDEAPVRRRAISPDGSGGVFFGTPILLYHHHPSTGLQELTEASGLVSTGALGLLLDHEGSTWVAAKRGLSRIGGFAFASYRETDGLLDDEVTAILQRRDGSFVLGHREGLTLMDDRGFRRFPFGDSELHGLGRVLDLSEGPDGDLWIAATRKGLGRFDGSRIEWSLGGNPVGVTTVRFDRSGRRLTMFGISLRIDDEPGPGPIPGVTGGGGVRRIFLGRDEAIYFCTFGQGLVRRVRDDWQVWATDPASAANSVYSVLERGEDGRELWVGTTAGLFRAVDGTLEKVDEPSVDRPIYFMLPDRDDRIWFGTNNGVLRWDGTTLDHVTVEDGLSGRETNRAAGLVDDRGRVWIGTTGGVTVYRPELDRRKRMAPRVYLRGLEASGEPVELSGEPIELPSVRDDLAFAFRAIAFAGEHRVRLQRWLEGHEVGWSESYTSFDQEATYTNLPPGRYRFHVRASTQGDVWSEPASSPEIHIVGPVWARPWFWGLMLLAGALMGLAVYRHVYQTRYARRLAIEVQQRVTELRRVEAELNKARQLESLGLLAGGIAHDFNNLLMVVLGNLSLVSQNVDETSRKWLADAETAIERARELTGQLLTFSRGGAPVRNPERIQNVVDDSARFALSGSRCQARVDLPDDLRFVSIDAGQINQVLNNLLLNARQAMPDGGTITIRGRNVDEVPGRDTEGKFVAIEVQDAGPGIDPEALPQVFDPYFSTKDGGSGLGLATAYSIAHRHGGMLIVDSSPGQGATFTLFLPATDQGPDPEGSPPPPQRFPGIRVLVMDDETSVRDVLRKMLESLGCSVSIAADGEEAIDVYRGATGRGRRFDAVILDLTVRGGMGGAETLARLLEIDPEVCAVVASGYADAPIMAACESHGFSAVLTKPFDTDAVAEALRKIIDVASASEN